MNKPTISKICALAFIPAMFVTASARAETPPAQSAVQPKHEHGEYIDWRVLGVSHRLDKQTLRSIVGNDTAIAAARAGKSAPWPDGTILAKLVWNEKPHPNWPQAVIPGDFAAAEAMVKDSKKYPDTGGWGFGHWQGKNLVMYDKTKSATCFACHTPMKDHDYVHTFPVLQ